MNEGHIPNLADTSQYRTLHNCSRYLIGADGTLWSCASKRGEWVQLSPNVHVKGYVFATLRTDDSRRYRQYMHRLVLEAFRGPCPPGMQACHGNGDRADNRIENLRWDTALENIRDIDRMGRRRRGSDHAQHKLTDEHVDFIRSSSSSHLSCSALARMFGVHSSSVSSIRAGRLWKHRL